MAKSMRAVQNVAQKQMDSDAYYRGKAKGLTPLWAYTPEPKGTWLGFGPERCPFCGRKGRIQRWWQIHQGRKTDCLYEYIHCASDCEYERGRAVSGHFRSPTTAHYNDD